MCGVCGVAAARLAARARASSCDVGSPGRFSVPNLDGSPRRKSPSLFMPPCRGAGCGVLFVASAPTAFLTPAISTNRRHEYLPPASRRVMAWLVWRAGKYRPSQALVYCVSVPQLAARLPDINGDHRAGANICWLAITVAFPPRSACC